MHYGVTPAETQTQPAYPIGFRPVCSLDGTPPMVREQLRVSALEQLSLNGSEPIPIFEEAAQSVARLLAAPICLVSIFDKHNQVLKATMGLSSLGLMNQLAATRTIPKAESLGIHVVDSGQSLMLADIGQHPAFSNSLLIQKYGIQAYLGVPLMTSEGACIGTVEIMDLMPHHYTQQDLSLLELNARWAMSEYEKQCWLKDGTIQLASAHNNLTDGVEQKLYTRIDMLRMGLISELTQHLRNPLTAITGMAGMLSREIYGPLTEKQKEYASVVLNSSQNLLSLTNEIMELGELEHQPCELTFRPVDIEMLAQQSLHPIVSSYKKHILNFNLTVEPGSRIWVLDKRVIKQLIYYLVLSIAKAATDGSTIRFHISRKEDCLNLATWVSNPWLGDNLPQAVINWGKQNDLLPPVSEPAYLSEGLEDTSSSMQSNALSNEPIANDIWQELGLLLSQHFTDLHSGEIAIKGSQNNGYRCIVSLPSFDAN